MDFVHGWHMGPNSYFYMWYWMGSKCWGYYRGLWLFHAVEVTWEYSGMADGDVGCDSQQGKLSILCAHTVFRLGSTNNQVTEHSAWDWPLLYCGLPFPFDARVCSTYKFPCMQTPYTIIKHVKFIIWNCMAKLWTWNGPEKVLFGTLEMHYTMVHAYDIP